MGINCGTLRWRDLSQLVIVDEINFKVSRPSFEKEADNKAPIIKTQTSEISDDGHGHSEIPTSTNLDSSKTENNNKNSVGEFRSSDRLKNRLPVSYVENDDDEFLPYVLSAQNVLNSLPKCYSDIQHRTDKHEWEMAIKDELKSIDINKTWTIVNKPLNKNIISCKWVFTLKSDKYGNPVKYKARLVARGFSRKYPDDYQETFAPVARISSFRILLALANQHNLLVHQMDVKTAFLNGTLNEEIYMEIPEGINVTSGQVCKLNKALYGLKQAARCWYERFDIILKEKGFCNSKLDPCILYIFLK